MNLRLRLSVFIFYSHNLFFVNSSSIFAEVKIKTSKDSLSEKTSPNFASIKNIKKKKKVFFEYMYSSVRSVNIELMHQRSSLNKIVAGNALQLPKKYLAGLVARCVKIFGKCKEDPLFLAKKLLIHTDIVPPSIALAQAANESSWGTSRFAVQGNNYFGQWCFVKGCGLTPMRRKIGAKHEVKKFKSVFESVKSYIDNINVNRAYSSFRTIRFNLRKNRKFLGGVELAPGIQKYSERGEAYVQDILRIIRSNDLLEYDLKLWGEL